MVRIILLLGSIGVISEFFSVGIVIVYVIVEDSDFGFNGIVIC